MEKQEPSKGLLYNWVQTMQKGKSLSGVYCLLIWTFLLFECDKNNNNFAEEWETGVVFKQISCFDGSSEYEIKYGYK